jgi:excisionase family DNA binding protein
MRSVAEVASELEVSPERVRQLIASGALPAVRVGGRWVIEEEVVRRPDGRPWSEAAAWCVLLLALGRPASWCSVKQRQRARRRLADGVESHAARLSARSSPEWFRGHPAALRRLARDGRIVSSGVSAASQAGADLVVADQVEGYVRSTDLDPLIGDFGLERVRIGDGSVQLRVVRDIWPFESDERTAPRLVVALDLLDQRDERTRRAGKTLLDHALRELAL